MALSSENGGLVGLFSFKNLNLESVTAKDPKTPMLILSLVVYTQLPQESYKVVQKRSYYRLN